MPASLAWQRPPHDVENFTLSLLFLIVWRRKFIILAIMAVFVGLTFAGTSLIEPRYTAVASMRVKPNNVNPGMIDFQTLLSSMSVDSTAVLSEIEVIKSRELARKTIEALGLMADPELNEAFASVFSDGPEPPAASLLGKPRFRGLSLDERLRFEARRLTEHANAEIVIDVFLDRLSVRSVSGSQVIQIGFDSRDPRKAAMVANTLADLYIEQHLEQKFAATRKVTHWLDERLNSLRGQMREADAAVTAFRKKHNLIAGAQGEITAQQLSQTNVQLTRARDQAAMARAKLQEIEQWAENPAQIEAASDVLKSPLIQDLKKTESKLTAEKVRLASRYGALHPSLIKINAELSALRGKMKAEMRKVVKQVRNETEVAQTNVAQLESRLRELKDAQKNENELLVALQELMLNAKAHREIYSSFLVNYTRAVNQEALQESQAEIISYASVPRDASYPNIPLMLSLAVTVSAFLGMALALLLEKLDNVYHSPDALEVDIGLPCISRIPYVKPKDLGEKPADFIFRRPSGSVAEAVRGARLSHMLGNAGKKGKSGAGGGHVLVLTSSLPGEGKSTLAGWIARQSARSGKKVLLIDGDLHRPGIHKSFGLKNQTSLVEYLTGQAKAEDVVSADPQSALHVIFARAVPNSALDLLASARMKTLIEGMRKAYDLIVIDTPASLAVTDPRLLASHADQLLYIVEWSATPREAVRKGLKSLLAGTCPIPQLVMTGVDLRKMSRRGHADLSYYYAPNGAETLAA